MSPILWCKETPGLKLGPGNVQDGKVIVFKNGYAEVSEDLPDFAERMSWVNTPGCPHIEIITEETAAAHLPYNPNDKQCPETVPTDENLTGSMHEIRGSVPCTFRAPTTREIQPAHARRSSQQGSLKCRRSTRY
jgi:hypothetical protein